MCYTVKKSKNAGERLMTAEEMWKASGLEGEYSAWSFGDDADQLAYLVKAGIKTATCSLLRFYHLEGETLPQAGEYNIILDSKDNAVCITRTTKVHIAEFDQVSADHASKEGEGDRTLSYWRNVHRAFFTKELQSIGEPFSGKEKLVCEEFELI